MYKGNINIDDRPREEWERLILQWVHDEMGRRVLAEWLLDGHPYERIAENLNVSRGTVATKAKKCCKQLFSHCN